MAERNDMTAALVTAYTSPQLAAINEYLEAEKAVRAAAEILGLDADLMIAGRGIWSGMAVHLPLSAGGLICHEIKGLHV